MSQRSRPNKKNQEIDSKEKSGPPFKIRMGFPHMNALWNDFSKRSKNGELKASELKFYKKLGKALLFLSSNPFYPGLNSHEITALTQKYGKKIFESYLENNTPGAARIFWTYGPGRAEITILAIDPHPEPGKYSSVKLDSES